MFDLNPMDVLQQRKLKTVAPHFTELNISDSEIFEGIEDWIKVKLKGRYYICKKPVSYTHLTLPTIYSV